MKQLVLFAFISISITTLAQGGFIILRKHNQTLKTYFPSSYIVFQLSNKQWIEGRVRQIKGDSIYINQMAIRHVVNYLGLLAIDTVRLGIFKVHVNEIYALPKTKEGFSFIRNGTLFQLAGASYLGLNIINGLGKTEPIFSSENTPNLAFATGVFALGQLLHLTYHHTYILGKKYMLYTSNNILVK